MPDHDLPSYLWPVVGFRSRKAAQLAAFFASRSSQNGRIGAIDKLKLIKLIYLAEREHVVDHHSPMLYDELYSLPHGPICSGALNGIDGYVERDVWSEFVIRHGRDKVMLTRHVERDDLDELNDIDIEIAEKVWRQFGDMTASAIRNYTHEHCPEYVETTGRVPIAYSDILDAVGEPDAEAIDQEIRDIRRAEGLLVG